MTRPLLSAFAADAPFLVRAREPAPRVWAANRCAGAIEALAAALPRRRHALQCCDDPIGFVLGTLAAWRAGQTVVMPGTRLAEDLAALVARYPDSHVLDAGSFTRAVHDAVGARGAPATEAPATEPPASAAPLTEWPAPVAPVPEVPVTEGLRAQAAARWLLDVAPPQWPSFAPDPQFEAVVLFTSGSTRAPRANVKTWDALLRGAETFRLAFPPQSRPPLLVGTVDGHHMFGLEANLMAAIHCGYPLCIDRPQLPADFADLLRGVARTAGSPPLWLVTTPLQLSTFHRALNTQVSGVERVIVATMPLDRMLAIGVERDWNTRVDEIYGNTECGVMATRRAARDPAFRPAPGVRFEFAADGSASAARAPDQPVALDDHVAPCEGGGGAFLLFGRRSDLVKVAGKRSTLRTLDAQLLDIAGVVDGAFVVPGGADEPGDGRVAALAVAPGFTIAQLRRELARRVDPAFMPRPLLLADALPRDERGKLPRERLLQLMATLARGSAPPEPHAKSIQRERTFDASHPVFAGHFPGHPIVPGAMLIAEIEDLLEAHGYRALACESAKFLAPVAPRECCAMRVDCSDPQRAKFEIAVAQRVSVRGVMRCEAISR